METWFVTGGWREKIFPVLVERSTDACVWAVDDYNQKIKRSPMVSVYRQFHRTWADAHKFLVDEAEAKVRVARTQLQAAQDRLGNVKGMKEPPK